MKIIDTNYDEGSHLSMAARSGRIIAEMSTDESPLVGHITIGIYGDGTYSCGFKMTEDHPFLGPTMFCALVKEIIQRDLTGKLSADDYAKEFFR
ncbi:hypothetical protein [Sphingobium sp. YR768]|uniref:hypothetical protein n=1 Tax=Sphingobium sp. YR768 TaxID=1884365 RepID=UPI0008B4731E|nr:hypothetical protein [Sphingobium sp. YR768]SES19832.1 hypothetical protein SAMN05518866_16012 [Sphingobium sp. YR768]